MNSKQTLKVNMGFKAIITLAAQNDVDEAIGWYEFQKINLGERFIRNLSKP